TDLEDELLSAFPYQPNEAVLHTDASLMPRRRAAWQAWNFHLLAEPKALTTITNGMNHLQSLPAPEDFLVTLNLTDKIDPDKIIEVVRYAHPVFTHEGIAAQARHGEISGVDRIHYAGAYWRWGFHEDGVVSALNALEQRGRHARAKAGVA
ncbi:MAG: FAD-dependent oxidoreductase, partial [Solirubrobacterales bacterium]|nr:FAD-dependent oxidoreductase [Solirubrobacterales bacterium]